MTEKRIKSRKLIRTVSPERKQIFRIGLIIIGIIIIAGVVIFAVYRNKAAALNDEPFTDEDMMEKYVGPGEVEDRGTWQDPKEYYGFYDGDGAEGDVAGTFFAKEGDMKGIVPCGLKIEPAYVSYDDFNPYESEFDYGYLDSYEANGDPREIESQLGVSQDMSIDGSYRVQGRDELFFGGNVRVDISNVDYYLQQLFDPDRSFEDEPEGSYYGLIDPRFEFDYSLSGDAHYTDDYPDKLGELSFSGKGKLEDGEWSFTSSFSGQNQDIFRLGEVYLRCKLPCRVIKTDKKVTSEYDSFVNVYFKINEVRIGTRADCVPIERPDEEQ